MRRKKRKIDVSELWWEMPSIGSRYEPKDLGEPPRARRLRGADVSGDDASRRRRAPRAEGSAIPVNAPVAIFSSEMQAAIAEFGTRLRDPWWRITGGHLYKIKTDEGEVMPFVPK